VVGAFGMALTLFTTLWLAQITAMMGLQYVTLPGLHLPTSTATDCGRLADALRLQAEKTLIVCSCLGCTVHRLASGMAIGRSRGSLHAATTTLSLLLGN